MGDNNNGTNGSSSISKTKTKAAAFVCAELILEHINTHTTTPWETLRYSSNFAMDDRRKILKENIRECNNFWSWGLGTILCNICLNGEEKTGRNFVQRDSSSLWYNLYVILFVNTVRFDIPHKCSSR